MSDEKKQDRSVMLKNARIAFAEGVFKPSQFEGTGEPRYSFTLLVDRGSENDKALQFEIKQAAVRQWADKADLIMESIPKGPQARCYYNGDLKDYDGFKGMNALSCVRPQKKGPVLVIDRDRSELTANDGRPYSGCYVNAKVQIWAQDNKYGKGIRCTAVTVQFVKDGDAFGGGGPATADGFEEVVDESMDDLVG